MKANADLCLAALAAQQYSVFSATQAAAVGFTTDDMTYRVSIGRWGRMHRAVFRIAGSPPTFEQAVMAAWLAVGGDGVVSHGTAASLLGYPVDPGSIALLTTKRSRATHRGIVIHRTRCLTIADRTTVGPFLTTSATRTLIDLAGQLDERRLIACVDAAVASRMTSVPYIRRRIDAIGRNGRAHLAAFTALLDRRYPQDRAPESVLERSVFDLLRALPGEPMVPQFWVQLPDGTWVRLDGAWPADLVAVESDSYRHHSSPDAWALDHTKRVMLAAMGWRILVFTDFDVHHRPQWVLEQAARARRLRDAS
jgi:hypothetical protein